MEFWGEVKEGEIMKVTIIIRLGMGVGDTDNLEGGIFSDWRDRYPVEV